jgi:hypothetical protein
MTCDSPTVRLVNAALKLDPTKSGMITPAARITSTVIPPTTSTIVHSSVDANLKASPRRPCWSRSVNTGMKAADSAVCANSTLRSCGI